MTDEETNPFLTQEILVGGGGRDLKQSRKLVASILIAVAAVAALLVAFTARVGSEHRILNLSAKRQAMLKDGTLKYGSLAESEVYGLFEDFKTTHNRKYIDEKEETQAIQRFQSFLNRVDARNEKEKMKGGTAVHGVTKFADISYEEFKQNMLGYRKPDGETLTALDEKKSQSYKKIPKYTGSQTAVDWRGVLTTDVKNQGYCSSCWAFAVTEQVESDSIRDGLISVDTHLSVQQLVSCDNSANGVDTINSGCDGGLPEETFDYIKAVGGLVEDKKYSYDDETLNGEASSCDASKDDYVVTVESYHTIDSEDEMIDYVLSTGPLSVCVDGDEWDSYQSGVMSSCGKDIDHCVQVVGVDTTNKYWIVRNSWGTDWGEEGFIYLSVGEDTCGISYNPHYATVAVAASSSSHEDLKKSASKSKQDRSDSSSLDAPRDDQSTSNGHMVDEKSERINPPSSSASDQENKENKTKEKKEENVTKTKKGSSKKKSKEDK